MNPQPIIERDPFYQKSLLITDGVGDLINEELHQEILEDLKKKVNNLESDNWMYEQTTFTSSVKISK
ncbi:hypothetical protein DLAC_11733 [Tieghemostelium lacteum]|uniref:Uncharacterized protein n=1 Tax=Tieghemostelium lacteum TaxID=361077 RepID=A0A151Z7U8_TIELA|nr:hypothetical protein DLAC_11733 [Tieghemostelium lacteum]|eukprot:KYQ90043.1 hypothetical protein DLAC_11733 [Tieghemostelium lacteum]